MKNTLPTYARYKRDYETAKSLGAAALACNAVLIPTGFEHMRLLFQNFTRPMVTNNDPADVDYAGGLAAHIQGVPKTDFETSVTAIETEKGALSKFAQAVVDNGGMLPECKVIFGGSDGVASSGAEVYTIEDVAVTFSDGGGEIDASSRSQILTVSGSIRYMYFGENANLGSVGASAFNNVNNTLSNLANGTDTAGALAGALGGLVNIMQNGGVTISGAGTDVFSI